MLVCVFLSTLCTRDRGCSAHPVFPAPSLEGRAASLSGSHCALFLLGRNESAKLGRMPSRECGVVVVARMSEATSGTSCPACRCAHAGYRLQWRIVITVIAGSLAQFVRVAACTNAANS